MKRILLLFSLLFTLSSYAQTTWTVNSLNDSGFGSLRAAANSCSAGDTIRFNPNLIANGSDSIVLTSGHIHFGNKGVIIKGLYTSSKTLRISGNNNSRIFTFGGAGKILLDSLILVNGNALGDGGAVASVNCTDTLFVLNSTISGNSSSGSGGGVSSYSNYPPSHSTVIVENSTISGNISVGDGGGVYSAVYYSSFSTPSSSFVIIRNSTISGNKSTGGTGGGVSSSATTHFPISTVTIVNSNISGNLGSIPSTTGGDGVYCNANSSTATTSVINVTSSIIAENDGNNSGIYNSATTTVTSNGNNIFSDSPIGAIATDFTSVSAIQLNLQPLAFNGGWGQTMLPGVGSIAIDNGNPNDNSNAQNAVIVGTRDIGSAEGCFAEPSSIGVTLTGCSGYTVPSGNVIYYQSGIYKDTIITACGADSIVTINLIANTSHSTDVKLVCDSLTWINGETYYSNNNTAKDTLMNAMGCDSIVTLDLTITNSSSFTDVITACDSLTWIDGVTYYSNNNTAMYTLVNAQGCDSVVTLDLTITNSTSFTDVITVCDSLTWMNGVTYYSSNNSAMVTLVNAAGCDSIVTLNLTIETVDSSVVQVMDTLSAVVSMATYQWFDCQSGLAISGANNQQYIPSVTGSYGLAISSGTCVDTSVCNSVVVCDAQPLFSHVANGGGDYDFTNNSLGSYTQTHWSFGDGVISTLSNPNHVYQANGNYVVVLTVNDSLASNSCVNYYMDTISVTGIGSSVACQAGFSVYYDTAAGSVNVVNSSFGSNLTYTWNFGDGSTSTLQYPTHSYTSNGPFNLCLTIDDGNGCADTYCDSITNTGVWFRSVGFDLNVEGAEPNNIAKVELSNNINIYPNPVHDQVNIEITNWPTNEVKIVVRDITGKQVHSQNVEPISQKETIQITTSKWAKGTYFIEVGEGESRVVERIVVQ